MRRGKVQFRRGFAIRTLPAYRSGGTIGHSPLLIRYCGTSSAWVSSTLADGSGCRLLGPTSFKDLEGILVDNCTFSNLHHASHVPAPVAVVRCRPDGDEIVRGRKHVLVAFLHKLMSPRDEIERVHVIELCLAESARSCHQSELRDVVQAAGEEKSHLVCHSGAKEPPSTSWAHAPSLYIIRIAPHQVYSLEKEGQQRFDKLPREAR